MHNNNRKNSKISRTTNIIENNTLSYDFEIDLDDPDVIAVDLLAQKEYEGREIPPFDDDEDFLYIETSKNPVKNNEEEKECLPFIDDIEYDPDFDPLWLKTYFEIAEKSIEEANIWLKEFNASEQQENVQINHKNQPLFPLNIEAIAYKRESKVADDKKTQNQLNKDLIKGAGNYTLEEIRDCIAQGHTVLQGFTRKWVTNSDCQYSQILWLDFDNKPEIKKKWQLNEVVEFLTNIGFPPFIAYHTFGYCYVLKHEKFRVGIAFDYPISVDLFPFIYKVLLAIFPEADSACKNISRKIYGTHHPIAYFNPNAIHSLPHLFTAINTWFGSLSKSTRNKYLDNFCSQTGISKQSSSSSHSIYASFFAYKRFDFGEMPEKLETYDLEPSNLEGTASILYSSYSPKVHTPQPLPDKESSHSVKANTQPSETQRREETVFIFQVGNGKVVKVCEIELKKDIRNKVSSKVKKKSNPSRKTRIKEITGTEYSIKALIEEVPFLTEVLEGKYQFGHNELFELVQMLYPFKGAQKYLNEAISNICQNYPMKHSVENYHYIIGEKFDWCDRNFEGIKLFRNCKTLQLQALEEELRARSFVDLYKNLKARKVFEPTPRPQDLIDIDEDMRGRFDVEFEKAINKSNPHLSVIGAYYGGGKTLKLTQINYVDLIKREGNIYFGTPYHSLKRQLYKRIRKEQKKGVNPGIKFTISSQRPNLPDINEQLEYESLMAMGATTHAHAFYTECVKKATGLGQYNLCRRYLRKLEELSKSDVAIVTHDYLLLMLESGKIPEGSLLIFDEDLLMSLQKQIKTISSKALKTLVKDLEDSIEFSEMTDIINKVKNRVKCIEQYSDRQEEVILFAPESELSPDEIRLIIHFLVTGSSAVFREQYKEIAAILSADGFVMGKDNHELVLHLINNWKLPNQYKYIVLTASGSEELYRRLAANSKINDFNYSAYPNNIALMGDIFQITDKNYSRTYLTPEKIRNGILNSLVDFVIENADLDNMVVITLKEKHLQKYFRDLGFNVTPLVLGAAEGNDDYKGKTILVVGTFSMPSAKYVAIAGCLGFRGKGDFQHNQKCEYNEVFFSYSTFTDLFLREVHFWVIDTNLNQGVGRARSARLDTGIVFVASSFPVKYAIYIKKGKILNSDRFNLEIENGIVKLKNTAYKITSNTFNDAKSKNKKTENQRIA